MSKLPRVTSATIIGPYSLEVLFDDGFRRIIDLEPELYGEVGAPLLDPKLFAQFQIVDGALVWPTGFDICPNYLRNYYSQAA